MKHFFSWLEGETSRTRKIMLFGVVICVLFIAVVVMLLTACGIDMTKYEGYFESVSYLAMLAIGFYTGTVPGKSPLEVFKK